MASIGMASKRSYAYLVIIMLYYIFFKKNTAKEPQGLFFPDLFPGSSAGDV
jgi:hypothetical protein